MRPIHLSRRFIVVALVLAAGCEAKKSSNPLSPTVAGPIPGVVISAPVLIEPAQGFKFKVSQQPIRLLIGNSNTSGVRPITYVFEVATDDAFTTKVFARAGVPPGDGGQTSIQIDKLDNGRAYYWRARAEDGANSSAFSAAAFEVLPVPQLDPPAPVSPVNNERVTTQRPEFRFRNSSRNKAVGTVYYEIQVAVDQAFTHLAASGIVDEGSSETTFTPAVNLVDYDSTYYWRARATDGEYSSAWMTTQAFRSMSRPNVPSPSPSPSPAPGGPCNFSSPEAIVQCERAKYGHMSSGEIVSFLRATAQSLNRNGIGGGPFGMLRKSGGSSCGGYSCDIICSGQGGGQRQWDVLGDSDGAQTPAWIGPKSGNEIRSDVCDIQ